jgi:hypothetical protein
MSQQRRNWGYAVVLAAAVTTALPAASASSVPRAASLTMTKGPVPEAMFEVPAEFKQVSAPGGDRE